MTHLITDYLVHRDYNNNSVKVKVLKVKFQNLGENQAEAHFKWESCFWLTICLYILKLFSNETMPWEVD